MSDLWAKQAAGNAVLVRRLLAEEGTTLSLRRIKHITAPARAEPVKQEKDSERFETPPGAQMQVDFGQMLVPITGVKQKVYFFVAVLGFSRRMYVMASLSKRQEDWQKGVSNAF